jgi:hypothetical protein
MAWGVAEGRVTLSRGGVDFAPAQAGDEADVRALLAAIATGGRYRLAFERAADALRPIGPTRAHVTMIARAAPDGAAVGVYERVTRRAFVDGAPVDLPYLAALRIAPSHRRRLALMRAGFESLRGFAQADETPFALTSIGADNVAARRLLTAGLPGLPRYEPAGELSTFALRCARDPVADDVAPATARDFEALADFLNARNATRQFAPAWSAEDLAGLAADGLEPDDILLIRRRGAIVGSIAAWDQTARRRTVVRAYPRAVRWLRPALNLARPLTGLPPLAPEGAPLRQATLALLAVEGDDETLFARLVAAALAQARTRGLDVAALGVPTFHPWREAILRRRRALEYRTELFRVAWPEDAARLTPLDDRSVHPEIALL